MSERTVKRGDGSREAAEFIGRQNELKSLETLLDSRAVRLITLIGPGGIGKTRLAAEIAQRYSGEPSTAVYWARLSRLAPNADIGTVAEEVVRAVAKSDVTGRSAWDVLVESLSHAGTDLQRTILVLDNCEHVLPAATPLGISLLEALPDLIILTTSREPMGWSDEFILSVPPLPIDQATGLFKRQARLAGNPVPNHPHELAIAEQICWRIDNNPLFIKLAAARLSHSRLAELLHELTGDIDDKRMQWAEQPNTRIDTRHSGVRNAIAWSYDMCSQDEQCLLERMSVFAVGYETTDDGTGSGGTEIDDIRHVCADPGLPDADIERLLERLVERSLVSVQFTVDSVRYYLLHSVRVFAADRLLHRTDENQTVLLARYRRYYRDKVVAGQVGWLGSGEQEWLDWTRRAWDNILQAIETSLDDGAEAVVGLEIAVVMMATRAPFVHGGNRAITRLTEQALDATRRTGTVPIPLRVAATAMVGWNALWQGRQEYTNLLLDECADACITDPELRQRWRTTAPIDIGLPAAVEFTWGMELILVELDPDAIDVLARARRKFAQAGDATGTARCELYEAQARALYSPPEQALEVARRYLDHAQASGSEEALAGAEVTWVIALTKHGDPHEAERVGRALIDKRLSSGDRWLSGMLVHYVMAACARELAGMVEAGADRVTLTAIATEISILQGGVATLHQSLGFAVRRTPLVARETEHAIAIAVAVLGRENYESAARLGARLRPDADELQRYVTGSFSLDDLTVGAPLSQRIPSRWQDLTPAESDVAVLAAAGWQNSLIAERRGTSIRTVDAQVAAIRQKLMVTTRSDIIWHIPEELDERLRRESSSPQALPPRRRSQIENLPSRGKD